MIRNKYELKAEKKRLREKEKEVRNTIVSNWKELKNTFRPKNLLSGSTGSNGAADDTDSILVNIFSYSGALLGRKLGEKAEEKLHDFLKKDE